MPSAAFLTATLTQPTFPRAGSINQRLRGFAQESDDVLQALWQQLEPPAGLSLIAVGGYGRGILFPFSDLDLLLLCHPDCSAEDFVSRFLTALWDLGQQIGASLRTVAETLDAARGDLTIATTLLECRFLVGDATLWSDLQAQLQNSPPWSINAFFCCQGSGTGGTPSTFSRYRLPPRTADQGWPGRPA